MTAQELLQKWYELASPEDVSNALSEVLFVTPMDWSEGTRSVVATIHYEPEKVNS